MNFISNFIEEKMVPVVSKFASLRYMRFYGYNASYNNSISIFINY